MQTFRVLNQVYGYSKSDKSYNEPMTTIFFRGEADGKTYRTYIVDSHKNSQMWSTITNQPNSALTVGFDNPKISASGIIDADCTPTVLKNEKPKIKRVKPTKEEVMAKFAEVERLVNELFE